MSACLRLSLQLRRGHGARPSDFRRGADPSPVRVGATSRDPVSAMPVVAADAGPELVTLQELESCQVAAILHHTHWNKGRGCEILGITRPTLDRKIARYGLGYRAYRTYFLLRLLRPDFGFLRPGAITPLTLREGEGFKLFPVCSQFPTTVSTRKFCCRLMVATRPPLGVGRANLFGGY